MARIIASRVKDDNGDARPYTRTRTRSTKSSVMHVRRVGGGLNARHNDRVEDAEMSEPAHVRNNVSVPATRASRRLRTLETDDVAQDAYKSGDEGDTEEDGYESDYYHDDDDDYDMGKDDDYDAGDDDDGDDDDGVVPTGGSQGSRNVSADAGGDPNKGDDPSDESDESDESEEDFLSTDDEVSDPEEHGWDELGSESDDSEPEDLNECDIPDNEYDPDLEIVRERIQALYRPFMVKLLPAPNDPVVPEPEMTVRQLVNRLVRFHLPQFWRSRTKLQGKICAMHRSSNTKPNEDSMLVTCVDCGFKFRKTLQNNEPSRDRLFMRTKVKPEKGTLSRRDPRPTKLSKAVKLFQDRIRRGLTDNAHFSRTDFDKALNDNRHKRRYDGNHDFLGVKQDHSDFCPRNEIQMARKLHHGWEVILGHDHAKIPVFPMDPPAEPQEPRLAPNVYFPLAVGISLPPTKEGPEDTDMNNPLEDLQNSPYYPARSLMAAFAHILPRYIELRQNQIQKLFVYFVWHPWFDCDLQAMTIRKGYQELWPLYLIRDEDANTEATEEELQRYSLKTKRPVKKERPCRKCQCQCKGKCRGPCVCQCKAKRRKCRCRGQCIVQEEQAACKDEKKKPKVFKCECKCLCKTHRRIIQEDEVRRARTSEESIGFVVKKFEMLETRFMTDLSRGMRTYDFKHASDDRTLEELARISREAARGWFLGPETQYTPKISKRLEVYWFPLPEYCNLSENIDIGEAAKDDKADETDEADEASEADEVDESMTEDENPTSDEPKKKPRKKKPKRNPCMFTLRLKNPDIMRPESGRTILGAVRLRVRRWFRRAYRRRMLLGFVFPEYMKISPETTEDETTTPETLKPPKPPKRPNTPKESRKRKAPPQQKTPAMGSSTWKRKAAKRQRRPASSDDQSTFQYTAPVPNNVPVPLAPTAPLVSASNAALSSQPTRQQNTFASNGAQFSSDQLPSTHQEILSTFQQLNLEQKSQMIQQGCLQWSNPGGAGNPPIHGQLQQMFDPTAVGVTSTVNAGDSNIDPLQFANYLTTPSSTSADNNSGSPEQGPYQQSIDSTDAGPTSEINMGNTSVVITGGPSSIAIPTAQDLFSFIDFEMGSLLADLAHNATVPQQDNNAGPTDTGSMGASSLTPPASTSTTLNQMADVDMNMFTQSQSLPAHTLLPENNTLLSSWPHAGSTSLSAIPDQIPDNSAASPLRADLLALSQAREQFEQFLENDGDDEEIDES
ncbi:hypothetical protein BG011_003900 [Mortierella polycephala]|uniref:Uncharacterized protein n=1 Tax=Mortierella polycephala TaxID=41804 RepID=A0A9P6Q386_9FUNG|nr:hypothetical protein BG011_003900 [Mortierella polycephala]